MGQIVQRQKRLRTLRFGKLEFHQLFASHLHRAMEIGCPECLKIPDENYGFGKAVEKIFLCRYRMIIR